MNITELKKRIKNFVTPGLMSERDIIRDLELGAADYWNGTGISPASSCAFYNDKNVNPDSPSGVLADLIRESMAKGRKVEPKDRISFDELLKQMDAEIEKRKR